MKKEDKERISILEYAINGNGVKGLADRMDDLEQSHKEIMQEIRKSENRQHLFIGGLIAFCWILEHFFLT